MLEGKAKIVNSQVGVLSANHMDARILATRSNRMANSLTQAEYDIPVELISLRSPVTPEQFEEFCRKYDELRLELTSTGELIIMPPAGAQTSSGNSNLIY